MSHYTVLVVLGKNPAEGALAAALQPFHEYGCDGVRDQYVVFVDQQEELLEDWGKFVTKWQDPADGSVYDSYDDVFYRPATRAEAKKIGSMGGSGYAGGLSFTTWYHKYKEGAECSQLMVKDERMKRRFKRIRVAGEQAHPEGFAKWAQESHGAELYDGRWGRWTNPNHKWDWWRVGGRWSGLLLLKPGAEGLKGEPGMNPNIGAPERTTQADRNGYDMAKVRDVDLAAMKIRNVRERRECVDEVVAKIMAAQQLTREQVEIRWANYSKAVSEEMKTWEALPKRKRIPFWQHLDASGHPVIVLERSKDRSVATVAMLSDYFGAHVPLDKPDLEAYITSAPALSTHAVLRDGKWYERGGMGWWGIVHDEEDQATWNAKFEEMLAGLDPNSVIAVVDCHI